MKPTRNRHYLLNAVFIGCLLLLLINDHVLKQALANELTGKLSDAAGIVLLPLLLVFLFPRLRHHAVWISGLLFAWWKSPFSEGAIALYNRFALLPTSRVVDFTDLWVLCLLPVPWFLIRRMDSLERIKIHRVSPALVLLPTVFALMATSPPPEYYYTKTNGNLVCSQCHFDVRYRQEELVEKLRKADVVFDSIAPMDFYTLERVPFLKGQNAHVYRINRLILDQDTLRNLDFTMRTFPDGETRIYFNGMQVSKDVSTWKLQRKLGRYYRHLVRRELQQALET